ncbi:MAG: low molecular weight protein arginine phosphatase [Longimicrobiales bacterium]|nr:low molecular weight protein arginine phosphatase [Longimicrobiales bacterium]
MELDPPDAGPFRLLFVCTGNTCRSPMAEAIARYHLEQRGWSQVEVASAGVAAFPGSPASEGAVRAAAVRGLDITDHASAPLTSELAGEADLILTMSASHLMRVVELGAGDRASVITSFAEGEEETLDLTGVPDPIGGPDEEYLATFDVLEELVERALERIAPLVKP